MLKNNNLLYADTANLNEIIEANELGAIRGVTTNPSLVSKEPKGNFDDLIKTLAEYCGSEELSLSAEVFALDYEGIISQASDMNDKFRGICNKFHVKIPVMYDGLKAIKKAKSLGISVNATACYTESQLQLCAAAGADYISLFYCRAKYHGANVDKILNRTSEYITKNNLSTKIIAGSIRSGLDVSDAWAYGADIVTTGLPVIKSMINHPLTTDAINQFDHDFKEWIA